MRHRPGVLPHTAIIAACCDVDVIPGTVEVLLRERDGSGGIPKEPVSVSNHPLAQK
jgi:hypothetical protein